MAAFYADYIADLRALFTELDRHPERFQTYGLRMELAAAGGLVVYETARRKGQVDSLFYGRSAEGETPRQVSQAVAFSAIDRFLTLGQFVALSGEGDAPAMDARYPHCAVNFSFRKKGEPQSRAMLMVFVGFNDDADAAAYVAGAADPAAFVESRPFRAIKAHEWK